MHVAGVPGATVDSDGNGWVYNWFCVDHVDYDVNPRRRDIGYHNVFDHYRSVIRETGSPQDGVQFHYHPHDSAASPTTPRRTGGPRPTAWPRSSAAGSSIAAGSRQHTGRGSTSSRPDSHWFLSSTSRSTSPVRPSPRWPTTPPNRAWTTAAGGTGAAPITWEPYHPAHDDYQARGSCRRWIARCLNIGTRYRLLSEEHVRQAFAEAEADWPIVLAFTNHDFRDMRPDIDGVRDLLTRVGREFPDVPFLFSEALTAMREALQLPAEPACELEVTLTATGPSTHVLESGRSPDLRAAAVAGPAHRRGHVSPRQPRHRRAVPSLALRVRRGDLPDRCARRHRPGGQQRLRRDDGRQRRPGHGRRQSPRPQRPVGGRRGQQRVLIMDEERAEMLAAVVAPPERSIQTPSPSWTRPGPAASSCATRIGMSGDSSPTVTFAARSCTGCRWPTHAAHRHLGTRRRARRSNRPRRCS